MIARLAKGIAVILAAAMLGALWLVIDGARPYLRSKTAVEVDIAPHTGSWGIAEQLHDAGVIRHKETFLALHLLRRRQTLKAGIYSFDHPISARDVLRQLVLGEVAREELTIPEGLNRFDIAALVENAKLASRSEFLKATAESSLIADLDPAAVNLEGYLFPDTYQFPRHGGALPIVRAMVSRFRQVYSAVTSPDVLMPVHEAVTMASLIEGETGNPDERPLVASVFYNRLKRGIALQCDPTVIYASILNNTYDGTITQANLQSLSPYNTYTHIGLPPGPISNPGKAALSAALHPTSSKYLYFVANSTGRHTFSRTLTEHNLAVNLYRRGLTR